MKRTLAFAHLQDVAPLRKKELKPLKIDSIPNSQDKVFDYIYAPDEKTGLPRNALGVFLDSNTSDVVREFVRKSLMASPGSSSEVPEGIPQSDIDALVRGRYETVDEYCERVNNHVLGVRSEFQKKVIRSQQEKVLADKNNKSEG